ncbi:UNVERIFIED_CONTAM: hypothetical protein FKN15_038534 [Acipenser sinensis]
MKSEYTFLESSKGCCDRAEALYCCCSWRLSGLKHWLPITQRESFEGRLID